MVFGLSVEQALEELVGLCTNVLEAKGVDAHTRTDLLKEYIDKILKKHAVERNVKLLDSDHGSNDCKL